MTAEQTVVRLKKGREKPIAQGHPWVFSGAVAELEGSRSLGSVVDVKAHDGTWLARGLLHPDAGLAARLYTQLEGETPGTRLFRDRIDKALELRRVLVEHSGRDRPLTAYRLVYSESDGLSGLIVDRYGDTLAVKVGAKVLLPFLGDIVEHLCQQTGASGAVCTAESDAVTREGIDPEVVRAASTAEPRPTEFLDDGLRFRADLADGQKTGFFLDQRVNRQRVASYAAGRDVLSAYCYTGAFEAHAARAGAASFVGIDSSQRALDAAEEHVALNGLSVPHEYLKADVSRALRTFRDSARSFGMIILDPPKFVANRQQLNKGLRAYKDINLWALKLLQPRGVLATFSCSGLVTRENFLETLKWAALDAGRNVRIIEQLDQPQDHPVVAHFPESHYMKGFICWVE